MKLKALTTTILAFSLTSLSVFAKEKINPLFVSGELSISMPEIIKVHEGTYTLSYAQDCGFFRGCKNSKFLLVSESENYTFPLSTSSYIDDYWIRDFKNLTEPYEFKSLHTPDESLRIDIAVELSEVNKSFEFKEIPKECTKICVDTSVECNEMDSFKRCVDPQGPRISCNRYETTCIPAYEACFLNTKAKTNLIINIIDLKSSQTAAKFTSAPEDYKRAEKVPMANCFKQ